MNKAIEQQELVLKSAMIFEDLDEETVATIYSVVTDTRQMKRFYDLMKRITCKTLFAELEAAMLDVVIDATKTAYNAGVFNSFNTDEDDENQDWIEFNDTIWAVDPHLAVDMQMSSSNNHDLYVDMFFAPN